MATAYPETKRDRDRWIVARRPARNVVDPWRPYAFLVEDERSAEGEVVPVATIFLTNRECPWRCLMCDLWRNTLTESVPPGAIPAQLDYALTHLPAARQVKLYNSGSFFDHRAILFEEYPAIAQRLQGFERVIVESHPALLGDDCLRFRDLLDADLEVAVGLETVHPAVGPQLNKGMTLDGFAAGAGWLRENGIALRVFVLVRPPFMDETEALHWAKRSMDFAFDCSATVVALIPTRAGNGALDALAQQGHFAEPELATLEAATQYGIGSQRGRVFADLWDLERFSRCPHCFHQREARLRTMNLEQRVLTAVRCAHCVAS